MQRICSESEASLDYYSLFKAIMKRTPIPMSPLESLASSAVRTAHKVPIISLLTHHALHLYIMYLAGLDPFPRMTLSIVCRQ